MLIACGLDRLAGGATYRRAWSKRIHLGPLPTGMPVGRRGRHGAPPPVQDKARSAAAPLPPETTVVQGDPPVASIPGATWTDVEAAHYARVPGPTTDTVESLLGRPALDFAAWAAEHAAAFGR